MTLDREYFTHVFRYNIKMRSRTAAGRDEGSKTSSSKKPLLLSGDALKAKVAENTERMIEDVLASIPQWEDVGSKSMNPTVLRRLCERWFDIANDGLYGPESYAEEFATLEADAKRLEQWAEGTFPLNRRYRLWTPGYTTLKVPPIMVERYMEKFYGWLYDKIWGACNLIAEDNSMRAAAAAPVMAYADLMMDGEIHPWMDACGRVSTALVMWIAGTLQAPLPSFLPKDEHYADIRDLRKHTAYYLEAMNREISPFRT